MDARRVAVVLTGVGKRYDIVSAFSAHAFTIAVDPSPLAPARYAADVALVPPRIDDPGYVPFLAELVVEHDVGAVVPLTDLDIEVLARSGLPAFVPNAEVARATGWAGVGSAHPPARHHVDTSEAHLCSEEHSEAAVGDRPVVAAIVSSCRQPGADIAEEPGRTIWTPG